VLEAPVFRDAQFPQGQYPIVIEETEFDLGTYNAFLAEPE
jgi:hypothetical protein